MINNFFNNEKEVELYSKNILDNLSLFINGEEITFNNLKKLSIKNSDINIDDLIFIERIYYLNNRPSIKIDNFTYIENNNDYNKISFFFNKQMLKDIFNFYFKSEGSEDEIIDFSKELSESFTNEFKLKFNEIIKEKEIIFNNDSYNLNFLKKEIDLEKSEEYIEVNFNIKDKEYFLLIKPFINNETILNITDDLENDEDIENEYNDYKEVTFSELILSLKTLNAYLNGIDYEKEKAFNKMTFVLIFLNFKNSDKINYNLLYNCINDINEVFKNDCITETNIFDNDVITSNVNKFCLFLNTFISEIFKSDSKNKDYLTCIVDDCFNTFFYEFLPKTELINKEYFNEIKYTLNDDIEELINNIVNDNKERNLKIIEEFSKIEKINDILLLINNDIEGLNSLKQQTNFNIDEFVQERLDVVLDEDKERNSEDTYVNLDKVVVKNIDDLLNNNSVENEEREKSYLNINFKIEEDESEKIKLSLSENEINDLLERADDFFKDKEIKKPINFNIDEFVQERFDVVLDEEIEQTLISSINTEEDITLDNDCNFNPLSKEEIERMLDACDNMEEVNNQNNFDVKNDFTYLLNEKNDTDIKIDFYKLFKFLNENELHLNNVEKSIDILKYILKNETTNKLTLTELLENFEDISNKNNLINKINVNDLEKKLFCNETSLNSLNDLLQIKVIFYFNNIIIDDKNLLYLIKFLENSIIDDLTLKVSLNISSKIIQLDNIIIKIDKNHNVIVLNN